MKVDTLITIGVVIYIIISIRKALSVGKKPADQTRQKPGWKQKLQDVASQIKEEIEKANQEMQSSQAPQAPPLPEETEDWDEDSSFWDDIEDEGGGETKPAATTIRQSVLYEPKPRVVSPPPIPGAKPSARDDETDHRIHRKPVEKAIAPLPICDGRKGRRPYRKVSKRHLRHAVIWSEILSKPLALRD
jgi:hypothetical protein